LSITVQIAWRALRNRFDIHVGGQPDYRPQEAEDANADKVLGHFLWPKQHNIYIYHQIARNVNDDAYKM